MDKIFNYFLFTVLLFLSSNLFAQQYQANSPDSSKIYKLSDVVVSATKTRQSELEIASSVTVIDSNQIADKENQSIFSLLRNVYGLSLSQQGAPGSLAYVYMRGGGSDQTLVVIDGVEMNMPNDPSNTFDFADLPVDNLQKVEVLRGPQSTLYGSDALAGVIDLITKKGYGKPKFFLKADGGAYSTFRGMTGVHGSYKALNYSLTLSRLISKGFSSASSKYGNTEKDGTSNYYFSSRIGADISNNFSLNLFTRYTKSKTDFDQHGGLHGDDPTYIYNLEQGSYRLEGDLSLFKGKWNQKFGVSFLRNIRKYSFDSTLYNPAFSNSIYDGKKIKIDWQSDFRLNKQNTITLGAETEKELATSKYYYNSFYSGITNSVFPENSEVTSGVFLQEQLKLGESFFNTVGIRYDNHGRFGSVVTYKIAPAYIFWQTGTKIRATYGTGFKTPSLFYLFDPAYGNPNLNPERSYGWDAGIEQYFWGQGLKIGATYFSNEFTDLFGFDSNFKTVNIDKAKSNGIEFYVIGKFSKSIKLNLNYTYTNTKDLSLNSSDNGKPLLRRPQNKIGFNLNYNFNKQSNLDLEIVYVGKREDKDFSTYPATRVTLGSYTIVNLAGSYSLTQNLSLFGRINNLFNKYYEEILGYATPGFSAYGGIKINFGI